MTIFRLVTIVTESKEVLQNALNSGLGSQRNHDRRFANACCLFRGHTGVHRLQSSLNGCVISVELLGDGVYIFPFDPQHNWRIIPQVFPPHSCPFRKEDYAFFRLLILNRCSVSFSAFAPGERNKHNAVTEEEMKR